LASEEGLCTMKSVSQSVSQSVSLVCVMMYAVLKNSTYVNCRWWWL